MGKLTFSELAGEIRCFAVLSIFLYLNFYYHFIIFVGFLNFNLDVRISWTGLGLDLTWLTQARTENAVLLLFMRFSAHLFMSVPVGPTLVPYGSSSGGRYTVTNFELTVTI